MSTSNKIKYGLKNVYVAKLTKTINEGGGYAYSYEDKSGKFENVFYLADTRMYKIKEAHHE